MALGNNNQNNGKLYILKIRTQDEQKQSIPPTFDVLEKGEENWSVTANETQVAGNLTKLDLEKRDNPKVPGEQYDVIKMYLNDEEKDETYLLDLRFNLLSRSLFNSLLSLEEFDNLKISLYESKKGEKTYPAISLRRGDEMVRWKHDLKSLPEVEEIKDKKGNVVKRVYDELNEFYVTELNAFAEKVNAQKEGGTPKVEKKKAVAKEKVEEAAPSDDSSDDIF